VHGDQVAARIDPIGEQGYLRCVKRHVTQDRNLVAVKQGPGHIADVGHQEFIQTFGPQYFRVVPAEGIRRAGNDEDWSAWAIIWRLSLSSKRPTVIGGQWVSGHIRHTRSASHDLDGVCRSQ